MAQRFGGEHSPETATNHGDQGENAWRGKTVNRIGARVNFLFLLPLPLAVRAFFLDASGMFWTLGGLGLLLAAAWLTREGMIAQQAYDARKTARRPAFPRKILASLLTGAGLFAAVWASDGGLSSASIYALLGTILHGFSFGLDPLSDKGMEGIDRFQQDRVARVVQEGEKHLKAMQDAIARVGERKLEARIENFRDTARDMFRTVEEDPRDLSSARRYLGVYLLGARDATVKFADLYIRSGQAGDRDAYLLFLDDLERGFSTKTRALLLDNQNDMTIEIEVLRERLAREGVQLNDM